jgi:hypothetical protein
MLHIFPKNHKTDVFSTGIYGGVNPPAVPSNLASLMWSAENVPDHPFGLIVSPHTVMEHIQSSISGEESLPKMEKLYKLKLTMICKGLAMTSFENKIPYFLTLGATHSVVRMEESHFSTCIATWWSNDGTKL